MLPQKAKHLYLEEEKKKPDINHEYGMFEKYDGWWIGVDNVNGLHPPVSRELREIPSLRNYTDLFTQLNLPSDCRVIAEAVIPGLDFHTMNGIFNRSVGNCHAENVKFYVHDIVFPYDIKMLNLDRYIYLTTLFTDKRFEGIELAPLIGISDSKEVWFKHFNDIVERGGEGLILKQINSPYQPDKRNSSLMKIKLEKTLDLLCIGWYKTIGEKGQVNYNLKLRRKSGTELDVRLGKHSDIDLLLEDEKNFVNRVVEVKCMKEIEKGKMLREPRFKAVRFDKSIREID